MHHYQGYYVYTLCQLEPSDNFNKTGEKTETSSLEIKINCSKSEGFRKNSI